MDSCQKKTISVLTKKFASQNQTFQISSVYQKSALLELATMQHNAKLQTFSNIFIENKSSQSTKLERNFHSATIPIRIRTKLKKNVSNFNIFKKSDSRWNNVYQIRMIFYFGISMVLFSCTFLRKFEARSC